MRVAICHSSALVRRKLLETLEEIGYEGKVFRNCEDIEDGFDILVTDIEDICTLKNRFKKIIWLRDSGDCEGVKLYGSIDALNFPKKELIEWLKSVKVTKSFKHGLRMGYVLIGASTGGPRLIETIVKSLPKNYPHPVCIVQHMPTNFTSKFASRLDSIGEVKVVEAEDGMVLKGGVVYIAKGGKHMHFRKKDDNIAIKLVPNYSNRFFVPSVDEMFFSALEVMNPRRILAVLLTGIGDDGADGMVALKKAGALTIAESENTAVVYGMPKEAKERGGAVKVLDFNDIVDEILKFGEKKWL